MKQKVFYLVAMLCLAQNMTAQLTSLGLVKESDATSSRVTGYMNYIPVISFVGDYLYVGTPKGVYRNLYQSQTEWEKLPLTDELVLDFEVRGDTLIVLTPNQLLCSWDGGNTVKQYPIAGITGKEGSDVLQGMAVHPDDATHILIGTNWSGLWRTLNGGSQWEEIIYDDGTRVLLDRIYFNPHDNNKLIGIFNIKTVDYFAFRQSSDGGSNWTHAKEDEYLYGLGEAYNVAFHPTKANRIVACGVGVYALSDDAGASWNTVLDPKWDPKYKQFIANISDVVFDTRNPDILYGADWTAVGSGATTVCRSTDGGYTWDKFFSDTIASKGHVLSFDMKDNILALYTYGNGIYLLDVDKVETPERKNSLVTEGKEWAVEHYTMAGVQGRSTYRLQGTTTINGKEYLIEHQSNNDDLLDMHPSGRYMREENGKVYAYTSKDSSEALFFDYTFIKGDTMRISPHSSICVEKVYYDTMSNGDGQARKCYEVSLGNHHAGMYIEGIGHTYSGLSDPCLETVGAGQRLLYVKQNDTLLYQPGPELEKKYFFPPNSIRCTCAITSMFDNDTTYYNLYTGNDTIVNGKSCVQLWGQGNDTPYLIHEDEGRVFINYSLYEDEWEMLYDFSLPEWHVGDKIYDALNGNRSLPIDSVSTITLSNGEQRQVAHYGDGVALIYGLGYVDEPFFEVYNRLYPEDGSYAHPISFYYNDELLWSNNTSEVTPSGDKIFSQDTKWHGSIIKYYWGEPSRHYDLTYHIGADTITDRGFGQNLYRNDEYWGTLITKGEQVWLYPSEAFYKESWYADETEEPFLLYDFSLQLNDTLYYTFDTLGFSREKPKDDYFEYMVVKNVYHTYGRKVIEFERGDKWAEGIGCLDTPILNLWRPMTTNGDGVMESIDCVEENGQVICSNGELVNPNIESWLKAGMTWTENKQYAKDENIVSRKITISEGDIPGFYNVSSTDSKYMLPFGSLQVTNNKVYGHGLGRVYLLYDFSLKVGDKISLLKYYCNEPVYSTYKYDQCYVTKVDTAVYNGVPRKRITLSGDREDVWVEGIGSLTRVFPIDAVNYDESVNAIFSEVVECTYNGETLYHKSFTPTDQKGYGIYRSNSFLEAYTLDETKEVTDSTDFARWNDKTVLYFDVDTIGQNAFTGATLRQGQILYFTERLNTIFKDAFTGINILCRTSQEAQFTDDLTLVFEGTNAPNIDKSHIMDYADSTHRINIAVPDIEAYVTKDLQWTYANLMSIDDLLAGYVSPENEVVVSDSVGVDLEVDVVDDTNMDEGGGVVVRATARPKKDIPVRIGDSNGGDIYSRAPAWMRYTVEIKVTDSKGGTLYTEKKQCSAYEECHFETTLTSFPEDGIVYVYSRSIDQYGNASDWTMQRIHLMSIDNIAVPESHSSYYDLTGRKVTHPTRGIYIKDGRKVIVHE